MVLLWSLERDKKKRRRRALTWREATSGEECIDFTKKLYLLREPSLLCGLFPCPCLHYELTLLRSVSCFSCCLGMDWVVTKLPLHLRLNMVIKVKGRQTAAADNAKIHRQHDRNFLLDQSTGPCRQVFLLQVVIQGPRLLPSCRISFFDGPRSSPCSQWMGKREQVRAWEAWK